LIPVAAGVCVLLSFIFLVPAFHQYFAERLATALTLEARDSSFYIRFVAPWVAIRELCTLGIEKLSLGMGPGLFNVEKLHMPISPNLNPISQVATYYGIFTLVAYLVFLWTVVVQRYTRAQWVIVLTVLFQYLFCAGNLLAPNVAYLLLWFVLAFCPAPAPTKAHAQARLG
jgi:hypothetical protein